jgi:hypothetical protein
VFVERNRRDREGRCPASPAVVSECSRTTLEVEPSQASLRWIHARILVLDGIRPQLSHAIAPPLSLGVRAERWKSRLVWIGHDDLLRTALSSGTRGREPPVAPPRRPLRYSTDMGDGSAQRHTASERNLSHHAVHLRRAPLGSKPGSSALDGKPRLPPCRCVRGAGTRTRTELASARRAAEIAEPGHFRTFPDTAGLAEGKSAAVVRVAESTHG